MCNPALIAGLVLSTAGAAYNSKIQNDAIKAQTRANNQAEMMRQQAQAEERARQARIDDANFAKVREATTAIAPDKRAEQVAETAAAPDNTIKQAAQTFAPKALPVGSDGEVISDPQRLGDAARRTSAMIDALAILSAQGVAGDRTADTFGRLGSDISTNNSAGARSLRVGELEARVPAARVSPSNSLLGDIMLAGGQAAAGYGGSKLDPSIFDGFGAWWDGLGKGPMTPPILGRGPS